MRRSSGALALLVLPGLLSAQPRRIVVIKADGLPGQFLEESVNRKNPETGRWALPWIRKVFIEEGAQVANFYTRGITVSAPSWSSIETGHNPIIRGNVEFDRYSLRAYDYLNFFPFYFRNALSKAQDMPAVETLDSAGAPMVADAFAPDQRYQGFQLFQRGVRWNSLTASLKGGLPHSVRNLVDEWLVGFQMEESLGRRMELELVEKLKDPNVLYLDLFDANFDHAAHLTHDRRVLGRTLEDLDATVGRIWTAIEASPLAAQTVLVMVSDHGMNNDPAIFGQGWNLVDALGSAAGGGHHVITNRHPRSDFKIRGLNPFVSEVTTESPNSFYLRGESANYPTALVDLDGNERASVYLRNSDWNALQILIEQRRRELLPAERKAVARAIAQLLEQNRNRWLTAAGAGREELESLQPLAERRKTAGLKAGNMRAAAAAQHTGEQLRAYSEYLRAVAALVDPPDKAHERPIPRRAMGELNSIRQLQNYVVGLAPGGVSLDAEGALDWKRTFQRVNYFAFFSEAKVRNVPQASVSDHPIGLIATRVPRDELIQALPADLAPDADGIYLYANERSQALLIRRRDMMRYLSVERLDESADGKLQFQLSQCRSGLPLSLHEELGQAWLEQWHSERDWLRATFKTRYSNAVPSLFAELSPPPCPPAGDPLAIFKWRERLAIQADILLLANDHWNFNVRNFNPGGNHGGFFQPSAHATLLFAGGSSTGIPRGLKIDEPYDGLSYAPTVLKLAGISGYANLPGPLIEELFAPAVSGQAGR